MEGIFYIFQASNMQIQGIVNVFLHMLMGGEEKLYGYKSANYGAHVVSMIYRSFVYLKPKWGPLFCFGISALFWGVDLHK